MYHTRISSYINAFAPIYNGQRNRALYNAGRNLRKNFGLTGDNLVSWLTEVNKTKCKPPLPGSEVKTVAQSVDRSDVPLGELPDAYAGQQFTNATKPGRKEPKPAASYTIPPFETFPLHEHYPAFLEAQVHRPEILHSTYNKVGAKLFRCGQGRGIAVPMFAVDGSLSGWVRYGVDGTKKISFGGTSGIVGTLALDALLRKQPAKIIFKTAGVSDYLALTQRIAATGLQSDYYAFTSGAGETESPDKFESILCPALTRRTVGVIQDNDETGAKGARRWAEHFAKYAADVCVIELPPVIFDCPVKDLRDFFNTDGTTLNDLLFQ
jgi:hypothetical protein